MNIFSHILFVITNLLLKILVYNNNVISEMKTTNRLVRHVHTYNTCRMDNWLLRHHHEN